MSGTDTTPGGDDFCVGLHHLGYLTADLPAAAEHFARVLGYIVESAVIEDPVQTARVQFLRQPRGTNWLELITPGGEASKLANALRKGDGWHHVCYEVTDIERACAVYRERQCFMIAAPTPAAAFPGRRIAWFMDRRRTLFELVESGPGPLSLAGLLSCPP